MSEYANSEIHDFYSSMTCEVLTYTVEPSEEDLYVRFLYHD